MNSRGFTTPQILIFILALAVVVGGYLAFGPKGQVPQPQTQTPISIVAEVDTTGWQTYTNSQYGFEFRYPSRFAITSPGYKRFSTGLVFLKYLSKEGTNENAAIYVSAETDPSKVGSCLIHEGGSGKSSGPSVLTQTTSTPSGIWYLDQSLDYGMSQKYDVKNFITARDGKCFDFSLLVHTANLGVYDPGTVTEFDATEVNSLFPQIFSTFKFISLASGWNWSPITILSPAGGEKWQSGKNYQIKWSGGSKFVELRLINLRSGGVPPQTSWVWRSNAIENAGVFPFSVPTYLNGDYQLCIFLDSENLNIQTIDQFSGNLSACGNSFSITP